MKTSKISLVAVLALTLTLGLAASSWARPWGGGMGDGMGGGMMCATNLTPDQAGKLFDLKEKFRNDTAEVRKQMVVKRANWRPCGRPKPRMKRPLSPSRRNSLTPSRAR